MREDVIKNLHGTYQIRTTLVKWKFYLECSPKSFYVNNANFKLKMLKIFSVWTDENIFPVHVAINCVIVVSSYWQVDYSVSFYYKGYLNNTD